VWDYIFIIDINCFKTCLINDFLIPLLSWNQPATEPDYRENVTVFGKDYIHHAPDKYCIGEILVQKVQQITLLYSNIFSTFPNRFFLGYSGDD